MASIELGTVEKSVFTIPLDALVQTFAFIGIRGSGKTSGAKKLAEEFSRNNLLWNVLDPGGTWWGMRADKHGKPNDLENVVVIGGKHGDLPLERTAGRKIAEALITNDLCAVIDLKLESKTVWRTFLADYCEELMRHEPPTPRHIFIEEAPQFVPQRPVGNAMKAAHAAVEKLITMGRNNGYGGSMISQRSATIDKNVLTQAENIFAMRVTHTLDRKAFKDWLVEKAEGDENPKDLVNALPKLKDGQGFFWSPQWLERFDRIQFSRIETFHPGETRKVGEAPKRATMCDARVFVERLKKDLTKTVAGKPEPKAPERGEPRARMGREEDVAAQAEIFKELEGLKADLARLKESVTSMRAERDQALARLKAVRDHLKPQYDALRSLFEDLGTGKNAASGVDRAPYETWLEKAGNGGIRRMLEVLLDRPELTRVQLGTLSGVSSGGCSFRTYLGWLRSRRLVETKDGMVRLLPV